MGRLRLTPHPWSNAVSNGIYEAQTKQASRACGGYLTYLVLPHRRGGYYLHECSAFTSERKRPPEVTIPRPRCAQFLRFLCLLTLSCAVHAFQLPPTV